MNVVQCDGCGKTTQREAPHPSWLILERVTLTYGVDSGPWHFCTVTCLAKYANQKCHEMERK